MNEFTIWAVWGVTVVALLTQAQLIGDLKRRERMRTGLPKFACERYAFMVEQVAHNFRVSEAEAYEACEALRYQGFLALTPLTSSGDPLGQMRYGVSGSLVTRGLVP